ncbi:MAG: hypothetical protein EHM26_00190 [Desulfobacteraceae bacterium]|nr:MAG: hypothetical protein EHM26_00190 [Desulfobacteraceae bacterium]
MAQQRDEDNFRSQVEDRLDHLFQEDAPDGAEEQVGLVEHPLKNLKAVLLSIDWEITDSTMDSLLNEIKNVEYVYSEDKILLTFLQLLGSIGRYVKANKGRAHPEATRVINSVYEALEKVALTEGMSRPEKEKMLLEEVAKFKKLKEQVVLRKAEKKEPEVVEVSPAPPAPSPEPSPERERIPATEIPAREESEPEPRAEARFAAPHEAFAYALEEIKDVIRAEFRALRAEIKLWRESK